MHKLIGSILLSLAAGVASAITSDGGIVGAPEIDPGSAISAATLLFGGLAVLRGRRARK